MSNIMQRGDALDTVAQLGRGAVAAALDEAQRECVLAAMRTGKPATVTLTIKFDPDTKTDAIRASGKIKTKLPEEPEKAALFFPTPEGNLTRHDPKQIAMFKEQHDPVTGEVIEA